MDQMDTDEGIPGEVEIAFRLAFFSGIHGHMRAL